MNSNIEFNLGVNAAVLYLMERAEFFRDQKNITAYTMARILEEEASNILKLRKEEKQL